MAFSFKNIKYILPVLFIILFVFLIKAKNQPACSITPAVLNNSNIDGPAVNLSWTNGQNSKIAYLNISIEPVR